jgi:DNA-binding NtrC family response regulator
MNDGGDSGQAKQGLQVPGSTPEPLPIRVGQTLSEARRILVLATLKHCGNHKTRAASMLGISLKTLYNHLNSYQDSRGD